jgi:hypothetical protein
MIYKPIVASYKAVAPINRKIETPDKADAIRSGSTHPVIGE